MATADTIVAAAKTGAQGVWKLIWWNILAIAARLVIAAWVLFAAVGYYVGVEFANTAVGIILGGALFLGVPLAYGAIQNERNRGDEG